MLSPRDLDLLLVRSCSLSLFLSLSFARSLAPYTALTAFKASGDLTNTTSVSLAHQHSWPCVGIDAIETFEKLHFLPALWAHFHHFYRLQTANIAQPGARNGASRWFR